MASTSYMFSFTNDLTIDNVSHDAKHKKLKGNFNLNLCPHSCESTCLVWVTLRFRFLAFRNLCLFHHCLASLEA